MIGESRLHDPGLLTANDFFEPLSPALPGRLPFGSTGMLRPPVVRLPAELDFNAMGLGILSEQAGMVRTSPPWVQPPQQNLRTAGRTTTGSPNVYGVSPVDIA